MYSNGNVWHHYNTQVRVQVLMAARPMGLYENGPTNQSVYASQDSGMFVFDNSNHFADGEQICGCERDGYRMGYSIDISNNGSILAQTPSSLDTANIGGSTAFYWKTMEVVNNYSDFPKYPSSTVTSRINYHRTCLFY